MKTMNSTKNNIHHQLNRRAGLFLPVALCLAGLLTISNTLPAQPIYVPNHSFDSPSAPMVDPYVTTQIGSWQKPAKPAYFDFVEANYLIFWEQTAGIFFGPGVYGNMDGFQAAYIMAWPEAGIFQDYDTMDYNDPVPSHEFDATFEIGKSYTLSVGVYGKGFGGFDMTTGSQLGLSLYYRDGANLVTVGSPTIITYDPGLFPNGGANLLDYSVVIPTVAAGDAWAGKNIGIKIESVYGVGDGYWDIDNVRLTAVPEPSALALAALGGLLAMRWRKQS
jgi:hypothetical protein